MTCWLRVIVVLGIALSLPAISFVLAQDTKVAGPRAGQVAKEKAGGETKEVLIQKAYPARPARAENAKEVKAVVVERAAVVKAAAVNPDPMIQQFTQQFRTTLLAEFRFVRSACEPSLEQRKTISREGERVFQEAAKEYAAQQIKMRQGGFRANNRQPNVKAVFETSFKDAMKPILSDEQWARYQEECEQRAAARNQASMRALVGRLDEHLVLSVDQIEKIGDALTKNWDEAWNQCAETLMAYGNQFCPMIPDKLILPHLNPNQKKVWEGTPKSVMPTFWGNRGFVTIDADPLGLVGQPEPPQQAAKDASKDAVKGTTKVEDK